MVMGVRARCSSRETSVSRHETDDAGENGHLEFCVEEIEQAKP